MQYQLQKLYKRKTVLKMAVDVNTAAGVEMLNDVNGLLFPYNLKKVLVITNAGGAGTIMSDLIGHDI